MLKKAVSVLFVFVLLINSGIIARADNISAAAAIVIDAESGEILYEKNIHSIRSMASTTKIMSALIACESGGLDSIVTITNEMVNTIGTVVGLRAGDRISLYDLIVGMLLASGNDAANSVAIYLGGSIEGFAAMMNERARQLGMQDTIFVTPSGLDEGDHHSCAYDMAVLTAAALKNDVFANICKEQRLEITINDSKLTLYNHNKLLYQLEGCVGVKTGYTDKAGRCLVSAVEKDCGTMICVTLGAPDDWNDHKTLYSSCEKKYQKKEFTNTVNIDVVGGMKNTVSASYFAEITVINPQYVTVEYYYFPFVYAPVNKGDEIGKAVIKYKEKEMNSVPIKAEESIEYYGKQE
ncbi:MAG: D-alanyl-D-alanine carboxypeptidase [Eubacterium sp.]|nr:D-alanyl-D-alanine carboxypeptidase [Eubacterium sp.]